MLPEFSAPDMLGLGTHAMMPFASESTIELASGRSFNCLNASFQRNQQILHKKVFAESAIHF